jgi:small subunit ribosomal protein S16
MLKIKFSRVGKSGQQEFRVIVQEHTKDPWGKYLENLGIYNPRTKKAELKADRIKEYVAKGAQMTDTVHNLMVSQGIIEGKKVNVTHISKERTAKMAAGEVALAKAKADAEAKARAVAEAAQAKALEEEAAAKAAAEAAEAAAVAEKAAKDAAPLVAETPVEAEAPAVEEAPKE